MDTAPLGRDRRKPGGQTVRMPRERSQDHAPAGHTKVSGDTRGTLVTREGGGRKTGDRRGNSGMSPSYGATGSHHA